MVRGLSLLSRPLYRTVSMRRKPLLVAAASASNPGDLINICRTRLEGTWREIRRTNKVVYAKKPNVYTKNEVIYNSALAVRIHNPPSHHPPRATSLNASVTSGIDDVLSSSSGGSRSNVLALEVGEEAGVSSSKGARAAVGVLLAVVAEVGLASGEVGGGSEDLAGKARLGGSIDVLEHVTLSENLGARVSLKSVSDGVEVVVDGVEEGVAGNLGRATRGVVDVVVLEGDGVGGTGEVQAPVVASVAGSGPGRSTVDLVVGDGDTVGSRVTEDDVLTGNQVGGDVVDPDEVCTVDGDGITTPDVLGVDIGEANVLDDDVLSVGDDANTLALNDTLGALADERLVGTNGHTKDTSLVVLDVGDLGGIGLVVVAPAILVDSLLACGTSSPRSATSRGSGALSSGEVKGLGQDNDARRGVGQVADQLGGGGRVDGGSRATTSNTLSETLSRSLNGISTEG
jgi:hypothetical protein